MQRFRAVLIDLDGTLLDTARDIAVAANRMLDELGMAPRSQERIATYVGQGIPMLVRRALAGNLEGSADAALFARGLPIFERFYEEENGRSSHAYPGVRDGLERMRALGLRLACVTNKSERYTLPLLDRAGLGDAFDLCVCGDTVARKKPDPMPFVHACERLDVAPRAALVIGDSLNDVIAARAAGCAVCCVPYGYNEGRPVESLDGDRIVASLAEAAALIERG